MKTMKFADNLEKKVTSNLNYLADSNNKKTLNILKIDRHEKNRFRNNETIHNEQTKRNNANRRRRYNRVRV